MSAGTLVWNLCNEYDAVSSKIYIVTKDTGLSHKKEVQDELIFCNTCPSLCSFTAHVKYIFQCLLWGGWEKVDDLHIRLTLKACGRSSLSLVLSSSSPVEHQTHEVDSKTPFMTSVQIISVSKSKFPLDQCRSRITAFWRLAQPRFPNRPNLEGLFSTLPPSHHPHRRWTTPLCRNTHRHTLFQTKWIE